MFSIVSDHHIYICESKDHEMDFSTGTNVSTLAHTTSSWIPSNGIPFHLRGVYYQDGLFVCGRYQECKRFPMGSDEWIDVPSFNLAERLYPALTVVDGRVFITGGRFTHDDGEILE